MRLLQTDDPRRKPHQIVRKRRDQSVGLVGVELLAGKMLEVVAVLELSDKVFGVVSFALEKQQVFVRHLVLADVRDPSEIVVVSVIE